MPPDSEPPRKFHQLKPKEFERVNDVPGARAAGPDASSAAGTPAPPGAPIDVRALARIATPPGPALGGRAANRPNDVHALLAENAARADAAGLNAVTPPPPRRSKRRRDYFLLLVPVNLFFAFWAFGPYANPVTLAYGVGGMAVFTAGLSWVMFGVMEDY